MVKYEPTKEEEKAMIRAYILGESPAKAAAHFGYPRSVCIALLERSLIPLRSKAEAKQRYVLDDYFFDAIDNEEKAYWLGFITADGYIRGNTVTISLKADDAFHIEKFLTDIKSDYLLSYSEAKCKGKIYPAARVTISSARIVDSLEMLGVGRKKSLTVHPCKQIPVEFQDSYWRGIVDGDGTISGSPPKTRVALYGNYFIVNGLYNFVKNATNIDVRPKPFNNIYIVSYSRFADACAVLNLLYANANVYLDRKYKLAQNTLK